jgi:hypothetical protein
LAITRRNILIYGAGGTGKSTLIADAAAYVHKTTGKRTRVIGADGGGTEAALAPLGDVAAYWPIDLWEEHGSVFGTMEKACKGWWPEDPASPGSTLLPPTEVTRPCPSCGVHSGAGALGGIAACVACKKPIPAGHLLRTVVRPINGMEDVGLVAFEGLTAFGELLMRRLRQKNPEGGRFQEDEGYKIAGSGVQHYGDAQNYLTQFQSFTRQIGVPIVIWTALEIRSDEENKPIYGPKLPGKALTDMCIPWFTDVIHLDLIVKKGPNNLPLKDANGMEELSRKMFLAEHFPPDLPNVRFKAKTSAGEDMPKILDPSMRLFFEEADKAAEKRRARLLG